MIVPATTHSETNACFKRFIIKKKSLFTVRFFLVISKLFIQNQGNCHFAVPDTKGYYALPIHLIVHAIAINPAGLKDGFTASGVYFPVCSLGKIKKSLYLLGDPFICSESFPTYWTWRAE